MDNEKARLNFTKDGIQVLATSYSLGLRGITLKGDLRCEQSSGQSYLSISMTFDGGGRSRVYQTYSKDIDEGVRMEIDLDEKDMIILFKDGQSYACKQIRVPLYDKQPWLEVRCNTEEWIKIELLQDEYDLWYPPSDDASTVQYTISEEGDYVLSCPGTRMNGTMHTERSNRSESAQESALSMTAAQHLATAAGSTGQNGLG